MKERTPVDPAGVIDSLGAQIGQHAQSAAMEIALRDSRIATLEATVDELKKLLAERSGESLDDPSLGSEAAVP